MPISIACWIVVIALIALATQRAQRTLNERQFPLMGIMAAFIFAAQMINFPVAGGTSGRLLGGVLAAVTLGPWAGILVMTAVIAVQALLFQDGGLLVMGANILNMGLITALIGYGLYPALSTSVWRFVWRSLAWRHGMLRYLDILADEALRLMRARDARSAGSGGSLIWRARVAGDIDDALAILRSSGSLIWRARVAGHMVGQLFLRSYERSERVHQAMLARGFDGRFLTVNPHQLHERDWWALAGTVSALALVQALGYMLQR